MDDLTHDPDRARALDTIAFPLVPSQRWVGEKMTEIVSLRTGGREMSPISAILPSLRCGLPPELRACREDEPAMLMQRADACSGHGLSERAKRVMAPLHAAGNRHRCEVSLN